MADYDLMYQKEQFMELIQPFSIHYDEQWKMFYYFNSESSESVWELPKEYQEKIKQFYQQLRDEQEILDQKIMKDFVPEDKIKVNQLMSRTENPYMNRPARKQVEKSLAEECAYKEGDQEYNIWYDKFLTDANIKDREAAPTRCDPELDTGYTQGDFKHNAYFCIHFARGCCVQGNLCQFLHRVPSIKECDQVIQSQDIFGRSRHARFRDDMAGIGSFMKETKTLYISDFCMPHVENAVSIMYEMLWRYFNVFGEIEDVNLCPGKDMAFIRYKHRCLAEFAKEALQNRNLDGNEILTIKWAIDEPNANNAKREEIENRQRVTKIIDKKNIQENERNANLEKRKQELKQYELQQRKKVKMVEKQQSIIDNCNKMNDILARIQQNNSQDENDDY